MTKQPILYFNQLYTRRRARRHCNILQSSLSGLFCQEFFFFGTAMHMMLKNKALAIDEKVRNQDHPDTCTTCDPA